MALGFLLKAVSGINTDLDELYVSQNHATFIKNMALSVNENSSKPDGTDGSEGSNEGVFTPIESTQLLCPIQLPEGENYCIGYYESKETNEGYVFGWNSNNNHFIYVIDGYTSKCTMVIVNSYLNFQLVPKHFISWGRCVLEVVCYFDRKLGRMVRRRDLYFTTNYNSINFLCVDDSIATNGFTNIIFQNGNSFPGDNLNLGIATPSSCISVTPVIRAAGDNKDNLLSSKCFQWRVLFIDQWNRKTEHGIISDMWYSAVSSCATNAQGQPRCVDLNFGAGDPTIKKIQIEYRIWNVNDPLTAQPTDWFLHDTIDKYDQTDSTLYWYDRPLNQDLKYDAITNKITYTFCADKGTTAITVDETSRNFNPIPKTASSLVKANKSIATANHERGYAPLSKSVLSKIDFKTIPPEPSTSCTPVTRTITIYAIIRTVVEDAITTIYKSGNDLLYGAADDANLKEYKQILPAGQTGFLGGFVGTGETVYSTQGTYNYATKTFTELAYTTDHATLKNPQRPFVQRFVFTNSKPGKKRFVVYGQSATLATDYESSSIACMGTLRASNVNAWNHIDQKEIWVDKCEGDFDSIKDQDELFEICDLTQIAGTRTNVWQGHLYEDQINTIPISNANVSVPYNVQHPTTTDRNGYWFGVSRSKGWQPYFSGNKNCKYQELGYGNVVDDAPGARFRDEGIYVYKNTQAYPVGDRIKLQFKIVSCDNPLVGVSGVLIWLTNGGFAVTDEKGVATILDHDRGAGQPQNAALVKIAQNGLCLIGRCDNECSSCFDDFIYAAPACTGQERIYTAPTISVKVRVFNLKGPQNSGHYEGGIVVYYGSANQASYVQRLPKHIFDTLSISETKVFGFSRFQYTISPDFLLPLDARYFTFVVSKNLNFDNFLTWTVDKFQFIDNTGNNNTVVPTQIKIFYNSLIEYSIQNGEATNAKWQFLADQDKEVPTVGDQVEFVVNGDNQFFSKRIVSEVKFDKTGLYFLLDYTDDLKNLKDGAQIKLLRPTTNVNSNFFFEQCKVIKVTNGKIDPADATGYINYFDAYMLYRQIPVPAYSFSTTTHTYSKDADQAKSIQKTFTLPFEHHSPSDFWGAYAKNRGRVYIVNPFENVQCFPTEIALTDVLSNNGVLNGLSRFQDANVKQYDEQQFGSITLLYSFIQSIGVICQHDNFEVPLDDNTLRVVGSGDDAKVVSLTLDQRLGDPRRKKGNNYGCHQEDINTVREYQGFIMFLDRSESALIALDREAQDISTNGFQGYMKDKIKHVIEYNQNGDFLKYFHAQFDPKTKRYILTMFTLPKGVNKKTGIGGYVNKLREINIEANETLGYDPQQRSLQLFYGFTPEYYGSLFGHKTDTQLISLKNAQPYLHHKGPNPTDKTYLNFYGEQCEVVYEVVGNYDPGTVKRFLWTEVMTRELKFFVDRIITEANQMSTLLLEHWDKVENFYVASFKCDLNTFQDPNIDALQDQNKIIFEGDSLSGKWLKARYIGLTMLYFELDGVRMYVFGAGKTGIGNKQQ